MQQLHGGHALAFLGRLDAIGENDQSRADLERPEQREAETNPASRELVQVQGLAVEEVEEAVVGLTSEPKFLL